jgi:hypothetical protein
MVCTAKVAAKGAVAPRTEISEAVIVGQALTKGWPEI